MCDIKNITNRGAVMNDNAALIEAIKLLGFDPTTIGSLCYEIFSSDLKQRFQEQGYAKTIKQIRRVKRHV
jgi:hypothetical protein